MLKPTTEVKLNNKDPKNSKLILNIFQEEVVKEVATVATKTEEETSTQEDVAAEAKAKAATETNFNMPIDAQADNDSREGSEDHVDTNLNYNFNVKPIEPFGYVTNQVYDHSTLISPDNIPEIDTTKGTKDTNKAEKRLE